MYPQLERSLAPGAVAPLFLVRRFAMFKYLNRAPSFLDVAILPLLVICARDPKSGEIVAVVVCRVGSFRRVYPYRIMTSENVIENEIATRNGTQSDCDIRALGHAA